jgi:hypothetical protein
MNRYQAFDFSPNWISGVAMKYAFNTGIFTSEQYKEQRKPLRLRPMVSMGYDILVDNAAKAIDLLRACLNSKDFVPIWPESIDIISSGGGDPESVTINTEPLANFFCLNNLVNHIILIDRNNAVNPAIGKIINIFSDSINVNLSPVDWQFNANTLLYPAREMILSSVRKSSITTSLEGITVSFDDYIDGTELAYYEA